MKKGKSKMRKMATEKAPMGAQKDEAPMFKRGGKVKKKEMKVEGKKAMPRLDKPMKAYKSGGVVDSTDAGVSPTSPMAECSPQRGKK